MCTAGGSSHSCFASSPRTGLETISATLTVPTSVTTAQKPDQQDERMRGGWSSSNRYNGTHLFAKKGAQVSKGRTVLHESLQVGHGLLLQESREQRLVLIYLRFLILHLHDRRQLALQHLPGLLRIARGSKNMQCLQCQPREKKKAKSCFKVCLSLQRAPRPRRCRARRR